MCMETCFKPKIKEILNSQINLNYLQYIPFLRINRYLDICIINMCLLLCTFFFSDSGKKLSKYCF